MQKLFEKLVPNQAATIESLYQQGTEKERSLICAAVASMAEDCPTLLETNGTDWVLCVLHKAQKSPHTTVRIFEAVATLLASNWLFTGVTNLKPIGKHVECTLPTLPVVANNCLLSLSFFPGVIAAKHERYGAPAATFYAETGKSAFSATGYADIAESWDFWVTFLNEELASSIA